MSQWHCYIQGLQYGPVEEATLRQWAREERIKHGDLVWTDGMPDWRPAGSIHGLIPDAGAAPGAPGQAAPARAGRPAAETGRTAGSYDPGPAYLQTHRGTLVLVLGLVGLVTCGVGFICGVIAWVLGASDLRKMRAGLMDPAGESFTRAGLTCGIIATFVQFVGGALLIAAAVAGEL